jgi:hypothetical protein
VDDQSLHLLPSSRYFAEERGHKISLSHQAAHQWSSRESISQKRTKLQRYLPSPHLLLATSSCHPWGRRRGATNEDRQKRR